MANKKHRTFLDLLIKTPQKEEPSQQEPKVKTPEEANFPFSTATKEEIEEKEWLAEAADEGQLTLDVYQTDKDIIIKSTIAGVKPEDLDISFNNGMITIKGERKQEEKIEKGDYFYQELYWGSFSRSVILPTEVEIDKIEATLKDGILTIKLPKKESAIQKKIQVKVS